MYYPTLDFTQTKGIVKYNILQDTITCRLSIKEKTPYCVEYDLLTAFHTLSLLHFPPLLSAPAFSTPAFSTFAVYSRIFHSCIFHSRIFSAPNRMQTSWRSIFTVSSAWSDWSLPPMASSIEADQLWR